MTYKVIADDSGAFIYDTTTDDACTSKIHHPYGFNRQAHMNLANEIIDRATSLYGTPSRGEWESVKEEVWEEEDLKYD